MRLIQASHYVGKIFHEWDLRNNESCALTRPFITEKVDSHKQPHIISLIDCVNSMSESQQTFGHHKLRSFFCGTNLVWEGAE